MDQELLPPLAARPGGKARRARSDRRPGEPRAIGLLYLAPALIVYAAFTLVPLVHAFDLSFFQWDGITKGTFVGLSNYKSFFTDPVIRSSYLHTLRRR